MGGKGQRSNLLIFSDDWGRHPSSCQYLTAELLKAAERSKGRGTDEAGENPTDGPNAAARGGAISQPVAPGSHFATCDSQLPVPAQTLWVNTIGTRPPRFDVLTLRRGLEKLAGWLRPGTAADGAMTLPPGLRVANPRMWPWVRSATARRINRRLLGRQLTPWLAACDGPWTGVTTIPIAALVMDHLAVGRWVYYCVDDFSVWPGLDGQTLLNLERQVVARADQIICASDTLAGRIETLGRQATVVTHGVHTDFWAAAGESPSSPWLDSLPHPLAVFWGVVDRRLDTGWLTALAASSQIGSIALVGPQQNPDPALSSLGKVHRIGAVPMEQLPAIASRADVLVMPYLDEPVTRAMQPLKLKEYLATGRPVVVRRLPATEPWSDCCDVVADPDSFVTVAQQRAAEGLPAVQQASRTRLRAESWTVKAEQFWRQVF